MLQAALNRAVAQATGETISEIRRRGFSVVDPTEINCAGESYDPPQMLDWDRIQLERQVALVEQPPYRRCAV